MWRSTFTELALGTFLTLVLTGILTEQSRGVLPPAPYYSSALQNTFAVVTTTSSSSPITDCGYTLWPSCGGSCTGEATCTPSFSCNPANPTECTALCICTGGMSTSPPSCMPPNCDDGNACTTDMCASGGCTHEPIADCCRTDGECASDDPCWLTDCYENRCFGMYNYACCDDGDDCTTDYPDSGGNCYHDPIPGCSNSSSSTPPSSAPESSSTSSAPPQQQCMDQHHVSACPTGSACLPVGSNPCTQSIPCCNAAGSYVSPSFGCCATAPCISQSNTCTAPSASSAPPVSSAPPASSSAPATSSTPASSASSSEDLVSCCFNTYCSDDVPASLCDAFGSPAEDPWFGGGNNLCDTDPCGGGASSSPTESSSAEYSSSSQPGQSSSAADSSSSSHSQPGPSSAAESSSSQPDPSSSSTSSEPASSSASSSSGCADTDKRSCCYDDLTGHHCSDDVCPDDCRKHGIEPYPVNDVCKNNNDLQVQLPWWRKWFAALFGELLSQEVKVCKIPQPACCRESCTMAILGIYGWRIVEDAAHPGQNKIYKKCIPGEGESECAQARYYPSAEENPNPKRDDSRFFCQAGQWRDNTKNALCSKCDTTPPPDVNCCALTKGKPTVSKMSANTCSSAGGYAVKEISECKTVYCCTDPANAEESKRTTVILSGACSSPAFVVTPDHQCKSETDCAKISIPGGSPGETYMGCSWKQSAGECSSATTAKDVKPNLGVCCCPNDAEKNCCRMVSTPNPGYDNTKPGGSENQAYLTSWQCTYDGNASGESSILCSFTETVGRVIYHQGTVIPGTAAQCKDKCKGDDPGGERESGCCCNLRKGSFAGTLSMWLGFTYSGPSPAEQCSTSGGTFTPTSKMNGKSCDNTFCEGEQQIACCPPKPPTGTPWTCISVKKSEKDAKCMKDPPKEFTGSMCPVGDAAKCGEQKDYVTCCSEKGQSRPDRYECVDKNSISGRVTAQECKDQGRKQLVGDCPGIGKDDEVQERCGNASVEKVHCCVAEGSNWTCGLKPVSECTTPSFAVSGKTNDEVCTEDEVKKCVKEEKTIACCSLQPQLDAEEKETKDAKGNLVYGCIDVKKADESAKCQKGSTFGELKCTAIKNPDCPAPPTRVAYCCSKANTPVVGDKSTCWQLTLQEGQTCDTQNGLVEHYATLGYETKAACDAACPPTAVPCCYKNVGKTWACMNADSTQQCQSWDYGQPITGACPATPEETQKKCGDSAGKVACCPKDGGECATDMSQIDCKEDKIFTGNVCPSASVSKCVEEQVACCPKEKQSSGWECTTVPKRLKDSKCDPNTKTFPGNQCPTEPALRKCEAQVPCCKRKSESTAWKCDMILESQCTGPGSQKLTENACPTSASQNQCPVDVWCCEMSNSRYPLQCKQYDLNTLKSKKGGKCPMSQTVYFPQLPTGLVNNPVCTEPSATQSSCEQACPVGKYVRYCCYSKETNLVIVEPNCTMKLLGPEEDCRTGESWYSGFKAPPFDNYTSCTNFCKGEQKPFVCCLKNATSSGKKCVANPNKSQCVEGTIEEGVSICNEQKEEKCGSAKPFVCCLKGQTELGNRCVFQTNPSQKNNCMEGTIEEGVTSCSETKEAACREKKPFVCCSKSTGQCLESPADRSQCTTGTIEENVASCSQKKTPCETWCCYGAELVGGGTAQESCYNMQNNLTNGQCPWSQNGGRYATVFPSEGECKKGGCGEEQVPCCQKTGSAWQCSTQPKSACTGENKPVDECPPDPAQCEAKRQACCTPPLSENGGGSFEATECKAVADASACNQISGTPKGEPSDKPCDPNPCDMQVPCCQKGQNNSWTCGNLLASQCADPHHQVSACPKNFADCGKEEQVACCVRDEEHSNKILEAQKCVTVNKNQCPAGKQTASCGPPDPCEPVSCCPKTGGECAIMQRYQCDPQKIGDTCTEELMKQCNTEKMGICCTDDGTGKQTKCTPDGGTTMKQSECKGAFHETDQNTCASTSNPCTAEKDTCCDPSKDPGQGCSLALDGQCPEGFPLMTKETCDRDGCAKPIACCVGKTCATGDQCKDAEQKGTSCNGSLLTPLAGGSQIDCANEKTPCCQKKDDGSYECAPKDSCGEEKSLGAKGTACPTNLDEIQSQCSKPQTNACCRVQYNAGIDKYANPVCDEIPLADSEYDPAKFCLKGQVLNSPNGTDLSVSPKDKFWVLEHQKCDPNPCTPPNQPVACCGEDKEHPSCSPSTECKSENILKNAQGVALTECPADSEVQTRCGYPNIACCGEARTEEGLVAYALCMDLTRLDSSWNTKNKQYIEKNLAEMSGKTLETKKNTCTGYNGASVSLPNNAKGTLYSYWKEGTCPSACSNQVTPKKRVACTGLPGPPSLATCIGCRQLEGEVAMTLSSPSLTSPLRAQTTGGTPATDPLDVVGTEFDDMPTCLGSNCPVGTFEQYCCNPNATSCSAHLLSLSEVNTFNICESMQLIGNQGGAWWDAGSCNEFCATFKGVDNTSSAGGGDQSSAGDEKSSSGEGTSSKAPAKGNCCVAGKDFGLCFADYDQRRCPGLALGDEQCTEYPAPGYNCGPPNDNSSSADASSSEGSTPSESSSSSGNDSSSSVPCGNGTVDEGEGCDQGDENSDSPNALCRTDCTAARCGDGIKDSAPNDGRAAEACDDGDDCSNGHMCNDNMGTATCKTNCKNRNTFFTIGQWLENLTLFAVDGTPVPNPPPVNAQTKYIFIGALTFILQ